jgi:hypothetical protein
VRQWVPSSITEFSLRRNPHSPGIGKPGLQRVKMDVRYRLVTIESVVAAIGSAHATQVALRVRAKTIQEIATTATAIAVSELNRQSPSNVSDIIAAGIAPNR